jgi:hypothetical protein
VYGAAVPSAFALKVGVLRPKGSSIAAIIVFLVIYALVPLLACVRAAPTDPVARLAILLAGSLLLVVSCARPVMNIQGRHEWPALFLLGYGGASTLCRRIGRRDIVMAVAGATATIWSGAQSVSFARSWGSYFDDSRFIGSALAAVHASGVLVVYDAGALPFYAEMQTRDVYGLADGQVARNQRRYEDVACDKDVTLAVLSATDSDVSRLDLENCGFTRRVLRRHVCRERWAAHGVFARDPDLLARLPQPDAPRDLCPEVDSRESALGTSFLVDTDLQSISSILDKLKSWWAVRLRL